MKKKTLTELFEKALNESEKIIESLCPSTFEIEDEILLREAKKKAKDLLDYGLQFTGALKIAISKKHKGIDLSEKYLNQFGERILMFYELSDNKYSFGWRRNEDLKGIAMRYHVLKPYFLLSQYGIEVEGKTVSNFSSILGKVKESIGIDETTCMCISSLSLLEIAINKKLTDLGEPIKGNFDKRYEGLVEVVRRKEQKKLPTVLPKAMYKARSLLLHGGHEIIPTRKESEQIMKWIEDFMTKHACRIN